jgi:general secretion pathway protein E
MPLLSRGDYPENPMFLEGLSIRFLQKHSCLPVDMRDGHMVIAVNDPLDASLISILDKHYAQRKIELALGKRDDIDAVIERLYGSEDEDRELKAEGSSGEVFEDDLEQLRDLAREAPIVRRVDFLINKALDMRASDVHFEPSEEGLVVRCRVDGILHVLDQAPAGMRAAIISRLKLMADLDIAERRLPQDGSIKWRSGGRVIDIRLSTAPTLYGESVVLRLLSRESAAFTLEGLGMSREQLNVMQGLITRANGMVLVTGPTGSGKTTTLYAVLQRIKDETKKIITVEDPVEYKIDGINQIQVKPQINLTFANALRSLVRQDPDVLLIGEIRDAETANIAIESALTGHLVLSTLHTKDAPGAVTRLRELGLESFLIADSMLAVIAQRLVRRLCAECRVPYEADFIETEHLSKVLAEVPENPVLHRPRDSGCEACSFTGFRGREGIFEILPMTEEIRSAIVAGSDAGSLGKLARSQGYVSMIYDGYRKVLDGKTTITEILRVTSA